MNTAYLDHLHEVNEYYDHPAEAERFIAFLKRQDYLDEPDVADYGKAEGHHVAVTVGRGDLETSGINPALLDDDDLADLLDAWADAVAVGEGGGRTLADSLEVAANRLGISLARYRWLTRWHHAGRPDGWTAADKGTGDGNRVVTPVWNGHPALAGSVADDSVTVEFRDDVQPDEANARMIDLLCAAGPFGMVRAVNRSPLPWDTKVLGITVERADWAFDQAKGAWVLGPDRSGREAYWFGGPCGFRNCNAAPLQARAVNTCSQCGIHMCEGCTTRCDKCGAVVCDDCSKETTYGAWICRECAKGRGA